MGTLPGAGSPSGMRGHRGVLGMGTRGEWIPVGSRGGDSPKVLRMELGLGIPGMRGPK